MNFRFFIGQTLLLALLTAAFSGCGGGSAARNSGGQATASQAVAPSVSTVGGDHAVFAPTKQDGAAPAIAEKDEPATASAASEKKRPAQAAAASSPAEPAGPTAASRVAEALGKSAGSYSGQAAECWRPLVERLRNDPKVSDEALRYFCTMPEYSPVPMGVKVKELFTNAFLRKKPVDDGKPKPPPSRIYRNVVTAANVQKSKDFLARNKAVFDAVEKKYPVPREVLVALLFVETRLGAYVGKENALWSLACMAAADSPERVAGGMGDIPITDAHAEWLQAKLTDKSRWAYNELRALLAYCNGQELDPFCMPGSVYGAIGICQFMPSNLEPYGDDGDGDGVINLFSEPDAIYSAARYLTKHGWTRGMGVAQQRALLKRYNNLNIYANTILALAESVRTGKLLAGPPDMVTASAAGKSKSGVVKAKASGSPQKKTAKKK